MEEHIVQEENRPRTYIQIAAPNSTASLVLGILSIPVCCCCAWVPFVAWATATVSVIMGILAIVLGNQSIAAYKADPDLYTEVSYKNTKAGQICGIISIVLAAMFIIAMIILTAMGILSEFHEEIMREFENEMQY